MPIAMAKNGSQLFGFDLSYQWESPSPVAGKIFCAQWRGHKISFWVINYIPSNQTKGGLNGWWGAEMPVFYDEPYENKQNRPETVKLYISTSQ